MRRVAAALSLLAVLVGGLPVAGWAPSGGSAQSGTATAGHPLVGSWLVDETNPPAGGEPVLTAVATFADDGTAVVSGFGEERLQGSWAADGSHEATFTVVAPSAGGFGEVDRVRAAVEVATDGGPFRGVYTFDVVRADGTAAFTYRGPIEGRRVEVQDPEPYP